MDNFVDLEEVPYNSKDFLMPDLGICHIRVKPHDNNKENPLAYIIKDDKEICAFGILYPYISNHILSTKDKIALMEFLNTDKGYTFGTRRFTEFYAIWIMWTGKNIRNGDPIEIPVNPPDYTKLP